MRWAEYDRVCKSPDDGLQNRELSWWLHKATCDLAALEPVPDQASQEVLAGLHPLTPQIGFSSNELRSAGSFGDFPAVSGQTQNSTASPQRSCRPLAGWPTESPQRADSPRSGAVTAPLSRRARARHHSLSNHGFPGVVLLFCRSSPCSEQCHTGAGHRRAQAQNVGLVAGEKGQKPCDFLLPRSVLLVFNRSLSTVLGSLLWRLMHCTMSWHRNNF